MEGNSGYLKVTLGGGCHFELGTSTLLSVPRVFLGTVLTWVLTHSSSGNQQGSK